MPPYPKPVKTAGRPVIHGGYSLKPPGDFLRGEGRARVRKYIKTFRLQIVDDLGGPESLTAAQVALVDRVTAKLTLARLMEVYIAGAGIFQEPGKVRPILDKYLLFTGSIREDLRLLGITRKPPEVIEVLPWDVKDEAEGGKEGGGEGHNQSGK